MQEIPEELLRGAFTVERALELGVRPTVLRGARFRVPFRGVRVPAGLPDDPITRCSAAVLAVPPGSALSHHTAAVLYGLPLPLGRGAPVESEPVHVSTPRGLAVPTAPGIHGHEALFRPGDVTTLPGDLPLPVTSAQRLLCDLASAGWALVDLVALADAALEARLLTRETLESRVASWRGRPGAPRLRRVVALAEERVDSPMETRLRLLLLRAGLPSPLVNEPVRDSAGELLHTPDLSWPRWRVAVDYDGAPHFLADERRRRLDIGRKEMLEDEGWVLRVMTSYDVLVRPELAVHRVRTALRRRGAPV